MSTLKDDRKHLRDRELGRHNDRKYKEALRTIHALEREVEAYRAVSVPPSKRNIKRLPGHAHTSQATAIAIASDFHIEEVVKPSTVQGKNKYNPDIAQERVDTFARKLVRLTARNRFDTTVDNLVLILGGDFISGSIHEELAETNALAPMEAILLAQDMLDACIRYIKENGEYKRIVVICKDGNHGKMGYAGTKIRHASRTGNSLEWAMYQNLSKRHPDIEWIIEDSYLTYYKVYDKVLRIHHGDAIRYLGGVGGLEIPMKRAYYQWNMTEPADINICGHFHQYMPGYNTVNGSLIGYNAYAAQNKFAYQPPMQAFLLLEASKGIVVHSPILV
jgi:hypothetical protein